MPTEKESVGSPESTRKSSKPIMEKRRRARINASLTELKSLLLEVMKKEGTRHNKMEKADILEMTVKHLRQIQRHQFVSAANTDPTVVGKYQLGFAECATEVTRYLSTVDGVDADLKTRMLNHLANSIQSMTGSNQGQSQGQMTSAGAFQIQNNQKQAAPAVSIAPKVQSPAISTNVSEINNNCLNNVVMTSPPASVMQQTSPVVVPSSPQKIFGGIQLIPSRMPNGDVAFIIPGNVLTNNQVPGYVIPLYTGQQAPVLSPQATQAIPVQPVVNSATVAASEGSISAMPVAEASLPPTPPVDLSASAQTENLPMNLSSPDVTSQESLNNNLTSQGHPEVPERSGVKTEVANNMAMDFQNEEREVIPVDQKVVQDENVWRPW